MLHPYHQHRPTGDLPASGRTLAPMRHPSAASLAFVVALLAAGMAGAQQRPAGHLPPEPRATVARTSVTARPLSPRGGLGSIGYARMILRQPATWPRTAERIMEEALHMVLVGPPRL